MLIQLYVTKPVLAKVKKAKSFQLSAKNIEQKDEKLNFVELELEEDEYKKLKKAIHKGKAFRFKGGKYEYKDAKKEAEEFKEQKEQLVQRVAHNTRPSRKIEAAKVERHITKIPDNVKTQAMLDALAEDKRNELIQENARKTLQLDNDIAHRQNRRAVVGELLALAHAPPIIHPVAPVVPADGTGLKKRRGRPKKVVLVSDKGEGLIDDVKARAKRIYSGAKSKASKAINQTIQSARPVVDEAIRLSKNKVNRLAKNTVKLGAEKVNALAQKAVKDGADYLHNSISNAIGVQGGAVKKRKSNIIVSTIKKIAPTVLGEVAEHFVPMSGDVVKGLAHRVLGGELKVKDRKRAEFKTVWLKNPYSKDLRGIPVYTQVSRFDKMKPMDEDSDSDDDTEMVTQKLVGKGILPPGYSQRSGMGLIQAGADTVSADISPVSVAPVVAVGTGVKSSWIQHVKAVAREKGISYKEALKVAKASYKK